MSVRLPPDGGTRARARIRGHPQGLHSERSPSGLFTPTHPPRTASPDDPKAPTPDHEADIFHPAIEKKAA